VTNTRILVAQFIGLIQCGLGGVASVFAYLVYANPSIRDALAITPKEVYIYMFLFLVFGIFSILSGLLLVREEDSEG